MKKPWLLCIAMLMALPLGNLALANWCNGWDGECYFEAYYDRDSNTTYWEAYCHGDDYSYQGSIGGNQAPVICNP